MFYNKKEQIGSTLVEIIISMMILSIAISSFISLEVKIFSNINEATKKQAIGNAVYNLTQNMLINPILNPQTGVKNYDYYNLNITNCSNLFVNNNVDVLSKENFAKSNLLNFCENISKIDGLSLKDIKILICNNDYLENFESIKSKNNEKFNLGCNSNGNQTIIKVLLNMVSRSKKSKQFYYSIAVN